MLKAFVSEGKTILLNSQNLGSFYGSYGSKAVYSRSANSIRKTIKLKVKEERKASSVSTKDTSKMVPEKSFSEIIEAVKELYKKSGNLKLSKIALKSAQSSKNSSNRIRKFTITSQTGSGSESRTFTQTGSSIELDISSKTSLGSESDTISQTGSSLGLKTSPETESESKTFTQTSLGSESDNFTETSLGSESDTVSQTGSNLGLNTSSSGLDISSETSLGSESDSQTSLGSESEEIPVLKVETVLDQPGTELEPIDTTTGLDIHGKVPKKIFPKIFGFASLINENKCLQKLVALQVDLSQVQKKKGIARFLVACDFEKHIAPHLLFLTKLDIENIGQFLTKNMEIVKTDLAVLENRLTYLKTKGFNSKDVSRIVSNSRILLLDTKLVDEKLGHLQSLFSLSGKEVREVLVKTPKLLNKPNMLQIIQDNKDLSKNFLGFSHMEVKTILLAYPGFFMKSPGQLSKMFEFLHNTMEIDHKTLVKNCHVFKTQLRSIQNRHLYLLKVNRAQYDPLRESFVSFNALVSGTNEEFSTNIAKTSLKDYYKFLECL